MDSDFFALYTASAHFLLDKHSIKSFMFILMIESSFGTGVRIVSYIHTPHVHKLLCTVNPVFSLHKGLKNCGLLGQVVNTSADDPTLIIARAPTRGVTKVKGDQYW